MYQIFQKMLYRTASSIIKSWVITFADEDEFDHIGEMEFNLSEVLDFAYCLAAKYEDDHPKEVKTYHVSR